LLARWGSDPQGYVQARAHVTPYLRSAMAKPQRLVLYSLMAKAAHAERDYTETLVWLNQALPLAQEAADVGAYVELTYLTASAHRTSCHFGKAASFHTQTLQALWQVGKPLEGESLDPSLEYDVLVDLGVTHSLLGNFEVSDWRLAQAERIQPHLAAAPSASDSMIPWTRALLARWRGHLTVALGHALQARDSYAQAAPYALGGQARIQSLVADIALDLVEQPGDLGSGTREAMLRLATPHVRSGLHLARVGADLAGEGLALLTQVRFDHLTTAVASPTGTLERVVQLATRLDDAALLSQAYMGLGKSFARIEPDLDAAISCYDRALAALKYSDVHTYEVLARREAWLAREQRV
jgi:tetratricopeptide (TPR) repeat protein